MLETENWPRVGARVRAAREQRGMSVRELARRVGVSASHVSQVERGIGSFSVPAFYAVARELESSVQDLLATEQPRPADGGTPFEAGSDLVEVGVVLRKEDRPTITMGRSPTWGRLTPENESDVEFLEISFPTGGRPAELITHQGREYGVVVEGELTLEVDGAECVLQAGDSFAFDSMRPHRFVNASSAPARMISFVRDRSPWVAVLHT